jgi:hypothetical protein
MLTLCHTFADETDRCPSGQTPAFRTGFAILAGQLGAVMGTPTSCEYADAAGTGDVQQETTTGLAFWRKSTNTPTFTNGLDHWALTEQGITHWTGTAVDPPAAAPAMASGFSTFAGVWAGHGRILEVNSDGSAFISYRTYRVCGQEPLPCDTVTGNQISHGGQIMVELVSASPTLTVGRIQSSSDPDYPVGTAASLVLDPQDAIHVWFDGVSFGNFCGARSPVAYCGA